MNIPPQLRSGGPDLTHIRRLCVVELMRITLLITPYEPPITTTKLKTLETDTIILIVDTYLFRIGKFTKEM
jgi:hypothetical protein